MYKIVYNDFGILLQSKYNIIVKYYIKIKKYYKNIVGG